MLDFEEMINKYDLKEDYLEWLKETESEDFEIEIEKMYQEECKKQLYLQDSK